MATKLRAEVVVVKDDETRLYNAEQKITPKAIVNSVNEAMANGEVINSVSTTLDNKGFTVKNGAIIIENKAGERVLYADVNGNMVGNNFTMNNLVANNGTFSGTIISSNAEITGGNINITSSDSASNIIRLNSTNHSNHLSPLESTYNQIDTYGKTNTVKVSGVSILFSIPSKSGFFGFGTSRLLDANGNVTEYRSKLDYLELTSQLRFSESNHPHIFGNGTTLSLGNTNNTPQFACQSGLVRPWRNGTITLGTSNHRWGQIFSTSGSISTSDKRLKEDINLLDEELMTIFISQLETYSYKLKQGTSGRTHFGLISQQVEDAMHSVGLTDKDFGGFIKSPKTKMITIINEEGIEEEIEEEIPNEYVYSLRYEEFIAPIISTVKYHEKRIVELEQKIHNQQNDLEQKQEKINSLELRIEKLEQLLND